MLLLAPRVPHSARSSCSLPLLALLLAAGCVERGLPSDPATSEAPLLASAEQVVIRGESVTAGAEHNCGISTAGVVYCWGGNSYGQLGDGTNTNRSAPVAVKMPPGVSFAAINAGGYHTVALSATGQAYAWGSGSYGELGDGSWWHSNRPVAVQMPEGVSFASVSAGSSVTVALSTEGDAYGWGSGFYGQLGNGEWWDEGTPVPAQMPDGVSFRSISTGAFHTLALSTTGLAYAWGFNERGELGDGTRDSRLVPVAVQMPAGVSFRAIGAGTWRSVALSTTGAAYAWGDGTTAPVAVPMPPGVTFRAISAGFYHALALSTTGETYAWGENDNGQLGDGTTTRRLTPVAVQMPKKVSFRSLAGGFQHSVAISTTGAAYAWGANWAGQLGDGTMTRRLTPVAVQGGISFK